MDGTGYSSPYGGGYSAHQGSGSFGTSFQMGGPVAPGSGYGRMVQPGSPYGNGNGHASGGSPHAGYTLPSTTNLAKQQNHLQEQCAEEGCLDEEKFGAENRGPSEYSCWGIDMKPILPIALSVSTVIGAICMLLVQIPLLSRFLGFSEAAMSGGCAALYGITLGCMTYCAFADPGQIRKSRTRGATSSMGGEPLQSDEVLPQRAHKAWQYERPIRRYDHYCKWLQNCIGLLNHREFLAMCIGLGLISVVGIAVDIWLAILIAKKGFLDMEIIILFHLAYSGALLMIAGPICRTHVGLVSRNEVAQEWKNNNHYIAPSCSKGKMIPVVELEVDEFNSLFDDFEYDRNRNKFDVGASGNCFRFWCYPRWPADEKGEF